MEALHIQATSNTPKITFNPSEGIFDIKGKSIPDDAESFYRVVLNWFDEYAKNPNAVTVLSVDLEYFNISSSKRLLFLLYKLNELHLTGHNVRISWKYNEEDEDMFEVGQDYAFMVKVPFDFVSYNLDAVSLV